MAIWYGSPLDRKDSDMSNMLSNRKVFAAIGVLFAMATLFNQQTAAAADASKPSHLQTHLTIFTTDQPVQLATGKLQPRS